MDFTCGVLEVIALSTIISQLRADPDAKKVKCLIKRKVDFFSKNILLLSKRFIVTQRIPKEL